MLTGCATSVTGEAEPSHGPAAAAVATTLPFIPTISGRTNERNDGTSFEPCTAYTSEELSLIGVVPNTASDAAYSDSPNYRGCHWSSGSGRYAMFSQTVGNTESLVRYKQKYADRPWQTDRTVNGRTVAMSIDPPSNGCFTAFSSQRGIVITTVLSPGKPNPEPDYQTECEMALTFTELATRKAPR
ncbi:DUF3558 domain-containing protein [Tsukamurella sp. 1534]|uniref:DUF3558 domain-containing protein n=1 Tax=Tsukamurella sp. 1534 TaxID=1151061 RepID=UPI0009DA61BF|nr:DUF3558 domain-containing protein [Tsukamurella sp. 1534]